MQPAQACLREHYARVTGLSNREAAFILALRMGRRDIGQGKTDRAARKPLVLETDARLPGQSYDAYPQRLPLLFILHVAR